MEWEKLKTLAADPANLSSAEHLPLLRDLMEQYPWFGAPYVMLARLLFLERSPYFDKYLKLASLYTGNREQLHRYIREGHWLDVRQPAPAWKEEPVEAESAFADVAEDISSFEPEPAEADVESLNAEREETLVDATPEAVEHKGAEEGEEDFSDFDAIEEIEEPAPFKASPPTAFNDEDQLLAGELVAFLQAAEAEKEDENVQPHIIHDEDLAYEEEEEDSDEGYSDEYYAEEDIAPSVPFEPLTASDYFAAEYFRQHAHVSADAIVDALEGKDKKDKDQAEEAPAPEPPPQPEPEKILSETPSTPPAQPPLAKANLPRAMSFTGWLDYFHSGAVSPQPQPAPPQAPKKDSSAELIERFIESEPRMRPQPAKFFNPQDMATKSAEEDLEMATETLAGIYEQQGLIAKAIDVYEKLSLLNPEKRTIFAAHIERLRNGNPTNPA